jgi:ureidoacrylate peracid hydrolase
MIYNNPETDGGACARFWGMDGSSMILREQTWHAELDDRLDISPDDIIITKRRYSAFFGTDLDTHLRCRGVREVVIAGVSSHICCEATAHDALFRDYDVFFLLDATGGNDEAAHVAVLKNIGAVYGKIITAEQAICAVS